MPGFRIAPAACAALLFASAAAAEGIPPAYHPVVIPPSGDPAKTEFDLTAAAARAKRENKRLYVYLGAKDCAYCRKYEAFLEQNAKELVPQFAAHHYLVVDLRSALSVTQDRLFIRVGDTSQTYVDFQKAIGDVRARMLVYPLVWLFDGNLKPLMQMPAGTGTFQTVPEQLEILQLVE
jgi:thiol-disulfide isomerase/thioredoxin